MSLCPSPHLCLCLSPTVCPLPLPSLCCVLSCISPHFSAPLPTLQPLLAAISCGSRCPLPPAEKSLGEGGCHPQPAGAPWTPLRPSAQDRQCHRVALAGPLPSLHDVTPLQTVRPGRGPGTPKGLGHWAAEKGHAGPNPPSGPVLTRVQAGASLSGSVPPAQAPYAQVSMVGGPLGVGRGGGRHPPGLTFLLPNPHSRGREPSRLLGKLRHRQDGVQRGPRGPGTWVSFLLPLGEVVVSPRTSPGAFFPGAPSFPQAPPKSTPSPALVPTELLQAGGAGTLAPRGERVSCRGNSSCEGPGTAGRGEEGAAMAPAAWWGPRARRVPSAGEPQALG